MWIWVIERIHFGFDTSDFSLQIVSCLNWCLSTCGLIIVFIFALFDGRTDLNWLTKSRYIIFVGLEDRLILRMAKNYLLWLLCYPFSFLIVSVNWTNCVILRHKKTNKSDNDRAHRPNWIPALRMIITDRKADAWVGLETATICNQHNTWRLPRIISGKLKLSHVEAIFVGIVLKTKHYEVPFKDVIRVGRSYKVVRDLPMLFDLLFVFFCEGFVLFLESHRSCFWHIWLFLCFKL